METPPAPAPRDLLPPLLACLPTAFLAPRPPPALLPLLSPILRQRVNLLGNGGSPGRDGWLPLLSWDAERASNLVGKVEGLQIEPHPVSGELELQDIQTIQYRRLDAETLQARLEVEEFELLPVYLWCENDQEGGGAGWRLAELRALDDREDGTEWFDTVLEATEAAPSPWSAQQPATNGQPGAPQARASEEDDDDYWASYDQTPGPTPAQQSPAPPSMSNMASRATHDPTSEEQDYYARYATEVQPALDSHDPDEEVLETGNSTLNGDTLLRPANERTESRPTDRSLYGADQKSPSDLPHDSLIASASTLTSFNPALEAPRATSPSSSASSRSVERLEQGAEDMTRAEVGVKQFVSTEIKSLFRLARTVGIDRHEFERMIKRELDVLSMLEADD